MATNTCNALQKSLAWCQGTPELPGVKRRIHYLAKSAIVAFPTLPRDANGRVTSAVLDGSFTLVADQKWKYIDILPDKSKPRFSATSNRGRSVPVDSRIL